MASTFIAVMFQILLADQEVKLVIYKTAFFISWRKPNIKLIFLSAGIWVCLGLPVRCLASSARSATRRLSARTPPTSTLSSARCVRRRRASLTSSAPARPWESRSASTSSGGDAGTVPPSTTLTSSATSLISVSELMILTLQFLYMILLTFYFRNQYGSH